MEATMPNEDQSRTVLREETEGALTAYSRSQIGPIGPTVEMDIFRLISWYGEGAVARALKQATSKKRGPKTKDDIPEIEPIFQQDALRWLEGKLPVFEIENDAIAKDFAKRNTSTMFPESSIKRRIKRKLHCKNYGRDWHLYYHAAEISRDKYPLGRHLEALRALASNLEHPEAQAWQSKLDWAENLVSDYVAYEGCIPPPELSFADVEKAVGYHYQRSFAVKPTREK